MGREAHDVLSVACITSSTTSALPISTTMRGFQAMTIGAENPKIAYPVILVVTINVVQF